MNVLSVTSQMFALPGRSSQRKRQLDKLKLSGTIVPGAAVDTVSTARNAYITTSGIDISPRNRTIGRLRYLLGIVCASYLDARSADQRTEIEDPQVDQ